MIVSDLQQFIRSLAEIFTAKTKTAQEDMAALVEALEPFKNLSVTEFRDKLRLAKEYEETGKITIPEAKTKSVRGGAKAKTPKAPTKTKDDTAAIQEAVDELEKLYSHAADQDLTYPTIEATIKRIHDAFDKDGLKEVAKGFNLTSGTGTKKGARDKIEQKIKERKARSERGEVIAAAAKSASNAGATSDDEDLVEATMVEDQ